MPPQQHLYNGLAHPVDYSILHGSGLRHLWASPCWHRNGLAWTRPFQCQYGLAAWTQRGLPTASEARADVDTGQTSGRTNGTDQVTPLQARD